MEYGERILQKTLKGPDVAELQLRLAGFRGTVPDGDFGPGTEMQVVRFQADYMKMQTPTGLVDRETFLAIDKFADDFPINFNDLKCPCGTCSGFGQGLFKGRYMTGKPKLEMFYRYEYPGVHRMILWAARALMHYIPDRKFQVNSSYRCSVRNQQTNRSSTNHHGKAVDLDMVLHAGEDKQDDLKNCNRARAIAVETAHAQIGWGATNRKALEPPDIAPTWVHYDVRCYDQKYLKDEYFCKTLKDLDNRKPIKI
ncbi:MAG TPA: peptidoglycan-binding domain-containing protein [Pyrinomonadaceae bacterium]|nr:peptidoglycan-binding domain-containing protein [Pyrinomonadaceae bacterium]